MDIVLDTNIFFSDFLMNATKFKLAFDYLKKTNSKIIVPQIVYQEIAALYGRKLEERFGEFKRDKELLDGILVDKTKFDFKIDFNGEVENYKTYFKNKLKIQNKDIIPYENKYLNEIVNRALCRKKPCTDKGQEFRDVLLWLTVLDIAKLLKTKELIFISNNTHNFSSGECSLHSTLLKDAEDAGLKINYYESIDHFIKAHAVKIDFITKDWLDSEIDMGIVDQAIIDKLDESDGEKLRERAESREHEQTTGYFNTISPDVEIDDFYIYEKTDGSYYVEANYYGEVEVEFEFIYKEEIDEGISRYRTETRTKCLSIEIWVTFGIEIKDKKISNFEIIDWEF